MKTEWRLLIQLYELQLDEDTGELMRDAVRENEWYGVTFDSKEEAVAALKRIAATATKRD